MKSPPVPEREEERLASLLRLKVLDTPGEEGYDRITRIARATFNVPIALVSLVDANRQWFKSRQGLDQSETSRDISFCGHAIAENATLVVPDALADVRFADNPLVIGPPGIRFYAGQLVRSVAGLPLGTLCIMDRVPRAFSASDRQRLEDLAALVEHEFAAHDLSTQWNELRERAHFFQDFLENSTELVQSVRPDGGLDYVNRRWRQVLGYEGLPLPTNVLDVFAPEAREHAANLFAEVLQGKEFERVETVFLTKDGARIPVVGSIGRQLRSGQIHSKGIFRDATPEARVREQLIANASTDVLTGLPNRRGLMDRLPEAIATALRFKRHLSVGMLDLDGFKGINDTHGHPVGDRVLRRLGDILSKGLRKSDYCARYGGEEFCVLFVETAGAQAMEKLERLRASFEAAGIGDSAGPPSTFSAGVAALTPQRSTQELLLAASDVALYSAKRQGRNRVVLASD